MLDIDIDKTIGFTGHRPSSLPWGYDENMSSCKRFKADLFIMLEKAINAGWTNFVSGLAIGFDTIAVETCFELKKKYPQIKIYGAIPHLGQEEKWSFPDKYKYHKILKKLDGYEVCSEKYEGAKTMYKRNQFIVDNCSVLIALWNGKPSGTSNTVNYAKKKNKKIRIINPDDYK